MKIFNIFLNWFGGLHLLMQFVFFSWLLLASATIIGIIFIGWEYLLVGICLMICVAVVVYALE